MEEGHISTAGFARFWAVESGPETKGALLVTRVTLRDRLRTTATVHDLRLSRASVEM
jgi:hypothetical protein